MACLLATEWARYDAIWLRIEVATNDFPMPPVVCIAQSRKNGEWGVTLTPCIVVTLLSPIFWPMITHRPSSNSHWLHLSLVHCWINSEWIHCHSTSAPPCASSVCACVLTCVRACVLTCVRACVLTCVRACVRVSFCVSVLLAGWDYCALHACGVLDFGHAAACSSRAPSR